MPELSITVQEPNLIPTSYQATEESDNRRPVSRQAVEGLPVAQIIEANFERNNETQQLEPPLCPICRQDICLGDLAMFMPCVHLFHPN